MKLTFNTHEFIDIMSRVFKATPKRSTLPVLEYAEFIIKDNSANVRATDQDVLVKAKIAVDAEHDCSFLMHRKAMGLIGTINADDLIMDYDPKDHRLTVITATGKHRFATLNADEYLADRKPIGKFVGTFAITNEQKNNLCNTVSIACSEDEFRPAMNGVLIEITENKMMMTATDSFRLVHFEDYGDYEAEVSVILPRETLDLLKLFDGDLSMYIYCTDDEKSKSSNVIFSDENFTMMSRAIDEQFPNYNSVLPDNDQEVMLSSKLLQQALDRIIYSLDDSHQVKFEMKPDDPRLLISAANIEAGKEGVEALEINKAADHNIGFNHRYLTAFVSKMQSSEMVKMTFSEPNRPACFFPDGERGTDRLFLLMPVRV